MSTVTAEPAATDPAPNEPIKYTPPNPSGICQCGCGEQTIRATRTRLTRGIIAGEFTRFLPGHSVSQADRPECDEATLQNCPDCGRKYHVIAVSKSKGDRPKSNMKRCKAWHDAGSNVRCRTCTRAALPNLSPTARKPYHGNGGRPGAQARHDPRHLVDEWEHFGEVMGCSTAEFSEHIGMSRDGIRRIIAAYAAAHPNDPRPRSYERAWEREKPVLEGWTLISGRR